MSPWVRESGAEVDLFEARDAYRGFIDDPRNTDNAWAETTAFHRHLAPSVAKSLSFRGGDDAADARWVPVSSALGGDLHVSHADLPMLRS